MKNANEKKIVVRVTPEEMKMLVSNREKRKKKYLKHLKRVKQINRIKRKIANYLYPIKQRIYGIVALSVGIMGFCAANGDGEIMFSAFMLISLAVFVLFTRKKVLDFEE